MSRSASDVPDGGYVVVYRRLWEHPVFKSRQEAAVFAWMLAEAAWRPTRVPVRGGIRDLQTGQLVVSIRQISEDFALHRTTVDRLMKRMIEDGMILKKSGHSRGEDAATLEIVNYAMYQGFTGFSQESGGHSTATYAATTWPLSGHYASTDPQIDEQNQEVTASNTLNTLNTYNYRFMSDDPLLPADVAKPADVVPVPPAPADKPPPAAPEQPSAPAEGVTEPDAVPTPRRHGTTRQKPPKAATGELTQDFERWFSEYPPHRRAAKGRAMTAYLKARTRDVSANELLNGLRSFGWQRNRWDPMPATWLNDQRWLDAPETRHRSDRGSGQLDWLERRRAEREPEQGDLIVDGVAEECIG